MIDEVVLKSAIEEEIKNEWSTTPIAWKNTPSKNINTDNPYIIPEVRFYTSNQAALGSAGETKLQGEVYCRVVTPGNRGEGAGMRLGVSFKRLFHRQYIGGARFTDGIVKNGFGDDNGKWVTPVSIPFIFIGG